MLRSLEAHVAVMNEIPVSLTTNYVPDIAAGSYPWAAIHLLLIFSFSSSFSLNILQRVTRGRVLDELISVDSDTTKDRIDHPPL